MSLEEDKLSYKPSSKELTEKPIQVLRCEASFNTSNTRPAKMIAAVESNLSQKESTGEKKKFIRFQVSSLFVACGSPHAQRHCADSGCLRSRSLARCALLSFLMLAVELPHPKDSVDYLDKEEVVYKITCKTCGTVYCGQPGRPVSTRIREHQLAVKIRDHLSEVAMNSLDTEHSLEWEKTRLVGFCFSKKADNFLMPCVPMVHVWDTKKSTQESKIKAS
ncbi:unnamed protein product [Dibothriocephalus latus]|uniref:GIY-YIG domain-containing protein n=1 Tax=Dibothriocephalus latus TaxID=60516 RepID=A0A3P7P103_DIBLA|nr:unnamed protein product [Dibothriocephalus latus]